MHEDGATSGAGGWRISICAAVSLCAHVGVAYALGLVPPIGQAGGSEQREHSSVEVEQEIPFVTLGERERAPLSLTWLALPEPENHASVDPSETVQPQLRDEETAPVRGERTGAVGPGRELTESQALALRRLARQLESARTDAVDALVREANALVRTPASIVGLLARTTPVEPETAEVARMPDEENVPAEASTPGGGAENPAPEARVTDREADPTSTIVAVVDDIGSDLVSEGLTLRTFKPVPPPGMQRASGSVVFDVAFDAEGKSFATIVEPSRHPAWDDLYKNVIFDRWSASGPAIEALEGTESRVRVRLQVNYTNRRR